MAKRFLAVLLVISCLLGDVGATRSWAYESVFGTTTADTTLPSIFTYGWQGLFLGLLAGASAGYVRYPNSSSNVLQSTGYGALGGAVFGLGMGFIDSSYGQKGPGYVILRDMSLAGGFGAAVGTIYGGITAIARSDWKPLGEGAAWGYLGGLLVGIAAGIYESARPETLQQRTTTRAPRLVPSLAVYQDSLKNSFPGLQVSCSF